MVYLLTWSLKLTDMFVYMPQSTNGIGKLLYTSILKAFSVT